MDKIKLHFEYMKIKAKLKNIPLFYEFARYIKWRIYRLLYIKMWTLIRNCEYGLKEKGLLKWNKNEQKLRELRNSHRGEIAFIIGNGPSLVAKDLDILMMKNVFTFASNRINLIYEKTKWRPNCYIAIDLQIYKDDDQTIFYQLSENLDMYVLAKDVYDGIKVKDRRDNVLHFHSKPNSYYKVVDEFSTEMSRYIVDGFTVTYTAIQLAYYMGFEKIYLLGVDCNYNKQTQKDGKIVESKERVSYFSKKYDPNNSNTGFVDGMMQAYDTANSFSRKHNFRIYNATCGGKLEIFERVKMNEIFENYK